MLRVKVASQQRYSGTTAQPHRLQTLFGTSIGVVEHRVSSPQHHVHTLTHRHRLQHLHHLFMRATQHAAVVDVDQDVRWRTETRRHVRLQVTISCVARSWRDEPLCGPNFRLTPEISGGSSDLLRFL